MKTITLGDNTLDSRDIIERIEELEGEQGALVDALAEAQEALEALTEESPEDEIEAAQTDVTTGISDIEAWDADNAEELANWKTIASECEGYGDWKYGETLIRDTYWVEYCEELCKDIGDLPQNIPDYIVIDWDATAENLREDYMEVEVGFETYLMKSC